jgi:hypothetical protein
MLGAFHLSISPLATLWMGSPSCCRQKLDSPWALKILFPSQARTGPGTRSPVFTSSYVPRTRPLQRLEIIYKLCHSCHSLQPSFSESGDFSIDIVHRGVVGHTPASLFNPDSVTHLTGLTTDPGYLKWNSLRSAKSTWSHFRRRLALANGALFCLLVSASHLWWDSSPTYQRVTLRPYEALHGPYHRSSLNSSINIASTFNACVT